MAKPLNTFQKGMAKPFKYLSERYGQTLKYLSERYGQTLKYLSERYGQTLKYLSERYGQTLIIKGKVKLMVCFFQRVWPYLFQRYLKGLALPFSKVFKGFGLTFFKGI
jgi:hypothetical protein